MKDVLGHSWDSFVLKSTACFSHARPHWLTLVQARALFDELPPAKDDEAIVLGDKASDGCAYAVTTPLKFIFVFGGSMGSIAVQAFIILGATTQ